MHSAQEDVALHFCAEWRAVGCREDNTYSFVVIYN